MNLIKFNVITKENLSMVIDDEYLPFDIINELYTKIYGIIRTKQNYKDIDSTIKYIIENYANVIDIFLKNNYDINIKNDNNRTIIEAILDTYMVPLIDDIFKKLYMIYKTQIFVILKECKFLHYSNFDVEMRGIMSMYYNDAVYHDIKKIMSKYKMKKIITGNSKSSDIIKLIK
jgi:hypothetical protein